VDGDELRELWLAGGHVHEWGNIRASRDSAFPGPEHKHEEYASLVTVELDHEHYSSISTCCIPIHRTSDSTKRKTKEKRKR
jgi:hypothetical protein